MSVICGRIHPYYGARLYVAVFSDGTVKPGVSQRLNKRMGSHAADAAKFGLTVELRWRSPGHVNYFRTERDLQAIARSMGGVLRQKEYFGGLDADELVRRAQRIALGPLVCEDPDAVAHLPRPVRWQHPGELPLAEVARLAGWSLADLEAACASGNAPYAGSPSIPSGMTTAQAERFVAEQAERRNTSAAVP